MGYSNKTIEYKYISSDFCFFVKNDINFLTSKEIIKCDIKNYTVY